MTRQIRGEDRRRQSAAAYSLHFFPELKRKVEKMSELLLAAVLLFLSGPAVAHDHGQHHEAAPAATSHTKHSLFHSRGKWLKEDGTEVRFADLKGKLSLVSMAYSSCKTACPMVVAELKSIAKDVPPVSKEKVQIVLFSFDEKNDTPAALAKFRTKMNLDPAWTLLSPKTSGDTSEIAALLGVKYKKLPDGHFVHSNVFFLVDEKGEILAKKEGLSGDRSALVTAMTKALSTR